MKAAKLPDLSHSDCRDLLAYWDYGELRESRVPVRGTINALRIVLVGTDRFVLRVYRHFDRARIEREHRVVTFARRAGVPAVAPLPTRTGSTFVEDEGRFVTLLPFIADTQISRDELEFSHVEAAGRFLAELHNTLQNCPSCDVPAVAIHIDRDQTMETTTRLESLIRARDDLDVIDRHALYILATRRNWLNRRQNDSADSLYSLPMQVVHGDYQESNLFFRAGSVSAIIDWDKVYTAPDAWEVVRTLHLMLQFEPDACRAFVQAYREQRELGSEALDIAALCYGLMRTYDLWLFEEIYDLGNDRLRQFVQPGGFRPIHEDWQQLQLD